MFADTNAKLGSICSESIGPYATDVQNLAGELVHKLLRDAHLFFPSTFQQFQREGQQHTWENKALGNHRIDFIGLPIDLKPTTVEAFIDEELDIGRHRDHYPVAVRFSITQNYSGGLAVRRKAIASRASMQDPVATFDSRLSYFFLYSAPFSAKSSADFA